ncbi:contractile injection system tape measure protein [Oxalobacteraceae bacterium A2-2]
MPQPAPHSIVRQVLEVDFRGSEAAGMALQRRMAELHARQLLPVIEQTLERCAPPHGVLRIDRLELDAGSVPLSQLEQALPALLKCCLDEALAAHLSTADAGRAQGAQGGASFLSTAQATDEVLAYFLNYGTLPAACHLANGTTLEGMLLSAWREAPISGATGVAGAAQAAPGERGISAVLAQALASAAARERASRQFTAPALAALLARMSPALAHALEVSLEILRCRGAGGREPPARRLLCDCALAEAVRATAGAEPRRIREALAAGDTELAVTLALRPVFAPGDTSQSPGGQDAAAPAAAGAASQSPLSASSPGTGGDGHPAQHSGIYVDNAGLVLLHPFINRLFDKLGVSDGPMLLDAGRALALLHYLATGRACAPEYALALAKVLCNVPLTAGVEADIAASPEEQLEADALLQAVIGHWTALRGTSPDGLRGAFLLRPGKLVMRAGEWLLQVEQQTADILLGQLPWGYSAVRLPWMDGILWVEWA